jgi:Ca-activated chloride channel family protein
LALAKRHIKELCDHLRGEHVALIAFAGSAHLVVPLTFDLESFQEILESLDDLSARVAGTQLSEALSLALDVFNRDDAPGTGTVLLLTDGEDHGDAGLAVAQRLNDLGVVLHTVGYGTTLGSKIPTGDPKAPYLKDRAGTEVITQLDPQSLRPLSQATGGESLSAQDQDSPLVKLYATRGFSPVGRGRAIEDPKALSNQSLWPLAMMVILGMLALSLPRMKAHAHS